MDEHSGLELVGAPGSLTFPGVCANCAGFASERLLVERRFPLRPHGSPQRFRRVAVQVPFCAACIEAHRRQLPARRIRDYLGALWRARSLLAALGAGSVAVLLAFQIRSSNLEPRELGLMGATLLFALIALRSLRAALGEIRVWMIRPTAVTEAFVFSADLSKTFERERHCYTLRNASFAAAFETSNLDRRWDRTARATRWSARLRDIVFAVVALSLLGWWLLTLAEN